MEVQYPEKQILNLLSKLTTEHYVEVTWMDACEIRDATPEDIEKSYHTDIKAIGRFYGIRGDYLIIIPEFSPTMGIKALCIPLGTIMKVRVLTRRPVKTSLRTIKSQMPLKVVYMHVKSSPA